VYLTQRSPIVFWVVGNEMKFTICSDHMKNDRQCTYSVTFRRVRVTIVAVEKQRVLSILKVYVCSLRYPA